MLRKVALISALICIASAASAEIVKLPNATVVVVSTPGDLSPAQYPTGSTVTLQVAQNVVINGQTVIKAGAPVIGIVDNAEEEGMVGQAGKISVSMQTVTAVDGTNIGLTGNFRAAGEDEVGGTVAMGVILCPLALLNKGGSATVTTGSQTRAIVNGDYNINVSPAAAPQPVNPAQRYTPPANPAQPYQPPANPALPYEPPSASAGT